MVGGERVEQQRWEQPRAVSRRQLVKESGHKRRGGRRPSNGSPPEKGSRSGNGSSRQMSSSSRNCLQEAAR